MKKLLLVLGSTPLLFSQLTLVGQNWVNGGNTLSANGKLGTKSNHSLIFITNNTERGRITNGGNWGIGTGSPASKLHVNSATGASPVRASIGGLTKFLVASGGGVSIGSSATPPANGLYVSGNTGIGTTTPSYKLHVVGNATITAGLNVGDYGITSINNSGSYGAFTHGNFAGVYGSGTYGVYAVGSGEGTTYGVYGRGGSYGLYGTGGAYGVYGTGTSYGVWGQSNSLGVYGQGGTYGLWGTGTSYGIYANATGTTGLGGYFYSTSYYGIRAATGRTDKNWAGVFDGNTYAYGAYQTSDKNLKKNIEDFADAMGIINKLKPRSYEFRKDGKLASLHLPKGKHYGFIAQELEEVLPNLVMEVDNDIPTNMNTKGEPGIILPAGPDGKVSATAPQTGTEQEQIQRTEKMTIKSINYSELIPVMLKAMQEQEAKIKALTQLVNKLSQNNEPGTLTKLSGVSLSQNTPNPPSANSTRINYNIPSGSGNAELIFTNNLGQKIKQVKLNSNGADQVDIDTSILSAGTYFYTLYVNGKSIDTKKMIVNR